MGTLLSVLIFVAGLVGQLIPSLGLPVVAPDEPGFVSTIAQVAVKNSANAEALSGFAVRRLSDIGGSMIGLKIKPIFHTIMRLSMPGIDGGADVSVWHPVRYIDAGPYLEDSRYATSFVNEPDPCTEHCAARWNSNGSRDIYWFNYMDNYFGLMRCGELSGSQFSGFSRQSCLLLGDPNQKIVEGYNGDGSYGADYRCQNGRVVNNPTPNVVHTDSP